MSKSFWLCLIAAPALFAQNVNPQFPKLRPLELNIRDFKNIKPQAQAPKLLALKKACAIPLRTFVAKGDYSMRVVKPSAQVVEMPKVIVPAPACEEGSR